MLTKYSIPVDRFHQFAVHLSDIDLCHAIKHDAR